MRFKGWNFVCALASLSIVAPWPLAPGAEFFASNVCGDDATGDGSRARPYRSVAVALTAAAPGDTVRVLPSADNEATCPPLLSYPNVRIEKDVCIVAEAGPHETRCDGFDIAANVTALIRGFTITNPAGDGISIGENPTKDDRVTVENCVIHECAGHGICIFNNVSHATNQRVWLKNCTIVGCAKAGIAMYTGGWQAGLTITNCIIIKNQLKGLELMLAPTNPIPPTALTGSGPDITIGYSCIRENNGGLQQIALAGDPKMVIAHQLDALTPDFQDAPGCDFRLGSTSSLRHQGNPACIYKNPDGTPGDPGAFGGPGSIGFFPQTGPAILKVEFEPSAQPGKVRVRVLTRER